jgi:hypothetical protein
MELWTWGCGRERTQGRIIFAWETAQISSVDRG